MEVIREVTADEDASSEIDYTDFRTEDMTDSFQRLRQEVRAEVLARQFEAETSASCCHSCSCLGCAKTFFLTTVICLIWIGLSVPTIFYIVAVVNVSEIAVDVGNPNESNASSPECTAEEYSGSVCIHQLSRLQECFYTKWDNTSSEKANGTIDVCITPQNTMTDGKPLDKGESLAYNLRIGQSLVTVSDTCTEQLEPFVCLYLFPLAVFRGRSRLGPTARSCMAIRDNLCTNVWKLIGDFGLGDILPNCEELEEERIDLLKFCSVGPAEPSNVLLNCTLGFKQLNSSCDPICQQWSAYSPTEILVSDILTIGAASCALLTGAAVLVIGCIRRKRIFSYPSTFVIYQTITPMLLAVLMLIGFAGRTQLFCSSEKLIFSITNPTAFCLVTGAAFHYFILQLVLLWFFHTTAVFQGTLFPFYTKRLKSSKKMKYIHALMVVLALVLPAVLVAIIASAGPGFTLTRQPTILCTGYKLHYNFACMVLPVSIVIAIGSTMLVLILWTIIKRHVEARRNRLRVNLNWTAEAKVMVVMTYHMILGVVVLTIFTNSIADLAGFTKAATKYFQCESSGPGNATACQSELETVEGFVNIGLTTAAFVLLGLYPTFNLVYTINIKELKTQLACMERKVEAAAPASGSRPWSQERRMGGNIQSVTPFPAEYVRNGEPHQTSSFTTVYGRPRPRPPTRGLAVGER